MNLNLNFCGFEDNLFVKSDFTNGVQYVFKFDNGYGASIVKHPGTYGYYKDLWELGVIEFDDYGNWCLCYYTEITDDVLGDLSNEEVLEILQEIKELVKPINYGLVS